MHDDASVNETEVQPEDVSEPNLGVLKKNPPDGGRKLTGELLTCCFHETNSELKVVRW